MILPDFSTTRILIAGDIMLDRYWTGGTARISPEAPVPVVNVNSTEDRPGGAANVAINAATLGAKVTLLGLCGNDDNAGILEQRLSLHGISHKLVRCEGYDTITKLRVMSAAPFDPHHVCRMIINLVLACHLKKRHWMSLVEKIFQPLRVN